jgi:hypothetical protein
LKPADEESGKPWLPERSTRIVIRVAQHDVPRFAAYCLEADAIDVMTHGRDPRRRAFARGVPRWAAHRAACRNRAPPPDRGLPRRHAPQSPCRGCVDSASIPAFAQGHARRLTLRPTPWIFQLESLQHPKL